MYIKSYAMIKTEQKLSISVNIKQIFMRPKEQGSQNEHNKSYPMIKTEISRFSTYPGNTTP